jgi:hypothetical protein
MSMGMNVHDSRVHNYSPVECGSEPGFSLGAQRGTGRLLAALGNRHYSIARSSLRCALA